MENIYKKLKNLKVGDEVRLWDDRNFVPEKSSNGGCYREGEFFEKLPDGRFHKKYYTSCESDFCRLTGLFQQCKNCWNKIEDEDTGEFSCDFEGEFLNIGELAQYLKENAEIDGVFVEYEIK